MTDPAGSCWAVLIGVNFYPKDRSLKGCVRDVDTIKQFLEAGPKPVDIVTLTATEPADSTNTRPIERPDSWPTMDNVISSLKRVLDAAKTGDFVYIHFSGHGTSTDTAPGRPRSLALVLFEDDEHGSSYLYGSVLAQCLRRMVLKGLVITLVLDCCYSGSVLRGGHPRGLDVRAIEYNPAIDAVSPQEPDTAFLDPGNTFRDSQVSSQWLVNPDGYTALSACGPHEKAWELETEGQRRGALSFYLVTALGALRKAGVEITHQSLYHHLRARFHASWPRQTPMRYGNGKRSFFGRLGIDTSGTAFIPVYRAAGGNLRLNAGIAHGVRKGDQYALCPFDWPEDPTLYGRDAPRATVVVETAGCLTSALVEVEASPAKLIDTGWKAKLMTRLSPWKIRIRLTASVKDQDEWQRAADRRQILDLFPAGGEDTEVCAFNVTVNTHDEYEILDGLHETIIGLPSIPSRGNEAICRVMDILEHLATYKYFEGIENRSPSASFENSFSLSPHTATGTSSNSVVEHGGEWTLKIENLGDKPLYITVFGFTPSWKVTNLVSDSGGGDYLVVPPSVDGNGGKDEVPLEMWVPEFLQASGRTQCEDIIKVFVTNIAVPFSSICLPEIPPRARELSSASVRATASELSIFLSQLSGLRDGNDHSGEGWATRNFIISTVMGGGTCGATMP